MHDPLRLASLRGAPLVEDERLLDAQAVRAAGRQDGLVGAGGLPVAGARRAVGAGATSCCCCWGSATAVAGRSTPASEVRELLSPVKSDASGASSTWNFIRNRLAAGCCLGACVAPAPGPWASSA